MNIGSGTAELQAFLRTAWKEPTQELRSPYFEAKKKVVMLVAWQSQRQSLVALSSAEAEPIASV